jgi:glucuronide carrier protein
MSKLGLSQYLGYAAGDAANNLAFSMTTMFLLLYYTDVAAISAATVGTILLVVRIWDAFADLFAGRMVDRTSTRWGKFRPFILFCSLPLLLLSVAVFSVPGWLSDSGKVLYALITYAVFGLVYSLVNIPYGSLAAAMTQVPTERARLATFRVFGSNITILMLALVVSPQIEGSENLQRSLTITVLTFVVVGMALYLFTFFTAKEQVERDVAQVSLRQSLGTLRQNRPLAMLCLSSLMFLTALYGIQAIGIYYARDVLGNPNLFIFMTLAQTIGTFLIAAAVPKLTATVGKKRAYLALGFVTLVAGLGLFVAPASVPLVAILLFGLLGIGTGGINTLMWAMEADTVEYGEWQTGFRTEGTTYSVFSFTRKMGQAIGGAASAFTIGLGGYVAGAATQPDSAATAIRAAAGLVPAGFVLIATAIMFFYPLTETRFREIIRDVAARRAVRRAGVSPAPPPEGATGPA